MIRRLAAAVRELRTPPTGRHRRTHHHPDVPPLRDLEVPPRPDTTDTQPIPRVEETAA